ncbi:MAG TPA: glucokinase, partial [Steroidobacteraceae bacterium]|nr:glucokinase [Steroidobacteraceae bacterium]
RGGMYIGGGIVPRFGPFFARSPFRERFEAKGRFASFLSSIPAFVITARNPALLGCARAFSNPSPRVEAG